jgi:diaminohydroxyphosphoribosylaminopyrimidine deaminase / 5-amino-6-(5-phosphoribosylamino)uracil reductase
VNVKAIMLNAITTAARQKGMTGSNPSVCAIACTKDGKIVAIGKTSYGGRPHAEVNLINILKRIEAPANKQLVLFTTLEPCSHYGQTPPCTKAIIESNFFDTIIIACTDPDPRVNGRGIKQLIDAGLIVESGVLADKASQDIYKEYFFARTNQMPFISLKLAMSLDGKIATVSGDSKWISSEQTRKWTNFKRSFYDAILIGSGTYMADNPELTCRTDGLQAFSPKRLVLSNNLTLVKDGFSIVKGQNGIAAAVKDIYNQGVNTLLIEGGARLATSFLMQNLVQELVIVKSPMLIGSDGIDGVRFLQTLNIKDAKRFDLQNYFNIDGDLVEFLTLQA